MTGDLLQIHGLTRQFGGLTAVDGVNMALAPGEILGLIGPNGAGKTVCFNLISGVLKPTSGQVWFNRRRIDGQSPHRVAARGIGRTFQIVKPFADLTVLENVLVAQGIDRYRSIWRIWGPWRTKIQARAAREILVRVGLADLADRRAGLLPLGHLRRLEIARALVVGHKLLLLDESFSGLRHEEVESLASLIRSIRELGIAVLLIEHNMRVAMDLCDRMVVLDHGRKIAEGPPSEIRRNADVIEAYLGGQHVA